MFSKARKGYEECYRRYKERPAWYFMRLEMAEATAKAKDKEYSPSSLQRAEYAFWHSGLDKEERQQIRHDVGKNWTYSSIKDAILKRYEEKHEMDLAMVHRTRNRHPHKVYIVEQTDLRSEDCDPVALDELHEDEEEVCLSQFLGL